MVKKVLLLSEEDRLNALKKVVKYHSYGITNEKKKQYLNHGPKDSVCILTSLSKTSGAKISVNGKQFLVNQISATLNPANKKTFKNKNLKGYDSVRLCGVKNCFNISHTYFELHTVALSRMTCHNAAKKKKEYHCHHNPPCIIPNEDITNQNHLEENEQSEKKRKTKIKDLEDKQDDSENEIESDLEKDSENENQTDSEDLEKEIKKDKRKIKKISKKKLVEFLEKEKKHKPQKSNYSNIQKIITKETKKGFEKISKMLDNLLSKIVLLKKQKEKDSNVNNKKKKKTLD